MLGATHALANPLTSHYGIVHGQAIGMMLPHVIRFNGEAYGAWYEDLVRVTIGEPNMPPIDASAEGLAEFVAGLVAKAGLPVRLADCGVAASKLAQMASDASKQWTGTFNPREVGESELLHLYESAC